MSADLNGQISRSIESYIEFLVLALAIIFFLLSAAIPPSSLPAHQCFVQDLLHTLQTAAEVELSLAAANATTAAPDQKTAASQQRRSMPHQQRPQRQQVQQPSLIATPSGGGVGTGTGSDGVDVSRSVRSHRDPNGEGLKEDSTDDSSAGSGDDDDGTAIRDDASSVAEDDATLAEEDAATVAALSSSSPGGRCSGPTAVRTAAIGARAQELAAARFAGMRSAAEAKSAASATTSGNKPEPSGSPSLGKGKAAVPSVGAE